MKVDLQCQKSMCVCSVYHLKKIARLTCIVIFIDDEDDKTIEDCVYENARFAKKKKKKATGMRGKKERKIQETLI